MMMVDNLSTVNTVFTDRVVHSAGFFSHFTADGGKCIMAAKGSLYGELLTQSHLWVYIDTFRIFALACLIVIPFIFFIKVQKYEK